ncbi:unnamed protein product, partial [Polarella glacialis]
GLPLPELGHRSRLWAVNISDGEEVAAWRVDAQEGGLRVFELPLPQQEVERRVSELNQKFIEAEVLAIAKGPVSPPSLATSGVQTEPGARFVAVVAALV